MACLFAHNADGKRKIVCATKQVVQPIPEHRASMNPLLPLNHGSPYPVENLSVAEREPAMPHFDVRSGRPAVFLAALTLGMLVPTRLAFAQG